MNRITERTNMIFYLKNRLMLLIFDEHNRDEEDFYNFMLYEEGNEKDFYMIQYVKPTDLFFANHYHGEIDDNWDYIQKYFDENEIETIKKHVLEYINNNKCD